MTHVLISTMDCPIVNYCNTCQELAGFYCNGCHRIFCQDHAYEHRQSLYEQLDWLTVDHDDFVHILTNDDLIQKRNYSSRLTIDKWEEESIKNIQRVADEARKALNHAIKSRIDDVKEKLKGLTEKLQEASHEHSNNNNNNNNSFDERNIKQWATDLHNIKQDFFTQPTFTVRIHSNKPVVMPIIRIQPDSLNEEHIHEQEHHQQQQQNSFGLILIKNSTNRNESSSSSHQHQQKLSSNVSIVDNHDLHVSLKQDDRFSICSDHVKILDDGQRFIHDSSTYDVSVGGHHEYSQGKHKLFFHIEQMTTDEWMFFGIISKHISVSQKAYKDSSAYGWAGYNKVYMNGKPMPILNGYHDDMKVNDFIELTIDCDEQTLSLWHSRQTYKNTLPVDILTCPFPWQFLISCHNSNDSVRILPLSMSSTIKREQDKLTNFMQIKRIRLKTESDSHSLSLGTNKTETVQ